MRHRSRSTHSHEDLNIWPAFTDLMSNAFMIINLFLLLALVKSVFLKSTSENTNEALAKAQKEVKEMRKKINKSQNDLQQKNMRINEKNNEIIKLQEKIENLKSPPLIVIKDSDAFQGLPLKFEAGRADLPEGLRLFINNKLVNQLEDIAKKYPGYVVEIIGHTDGQETESSNSNLDQILENVAIGNESVSNLKAGSNADLGLIRALAVVKNLQELQQQTGRLQFLKFRAYSAAQLFMLSGEYAASNRIADPTRRRIEIRFTPPAFEK
jgi:outer membrane protein OmpA-like peptidoglycan-associated protein